MTATIHQLSCSSGGVPKRAVAEAMLGAEGLSGDAQLNLEHHGGPDRAVCLFPLELIDVLRAEGHPIAPGSTGENITTVGLDWSLVVPGARLQLGERAVIEIVSYAAPCYKIKASFTDGDFMRISAKTHPGSARAYARVLVNGPLRPGDSIVWLETASTREGDAA